MNPRRDPEPPTRDLDPTSALLDRVLAAGAGEQHALLAQLSARHPRMCRGLSRTLPRTSKIWGYWTVTTAVAG